MEKPKNLHHQSNAGILAFFQGAVNSGKGVRKVTSDSLAGRRITSAKGSIFSDSNEFIKQSVLKRKAELPLPGCGAKEVARRAKQIATLQHEGTFRQYRILAG